MTVAAQLRCSVHGPIDPRVPPGEGPTGPTCPVSARRTVGEYDEYAVCGRPLLQEGAS